MKELIDTIMAMSRETAISPPMKGAMAAAGVAFLRVMYDNKEPRVVRRLLEVCLCGAITWFASYILPYIGISTDWSVFLGGSIGLIGADQVRSWGQSIAQRRVDSITKPQENANDRS